MSNRLLRRVLKEREEKRFASSDLDPEAAAIENDEESDSPPAGSRFKNPFDLLDDQVDYRFFRFLFLIP